MPPEINTREAVNRALAAMEIAESCPHPDIRSSFTELAGVWLERAEAAARDNGAGQDGLTPDEAPGTR